MSSQATAGMMVLPPDRSAQPLGPERPGEEPEAPRSFTQQAVHDTLRRTGAKMGLLWISILAFCGVFAPFLASSHPILLKMNDRWSSPLLRHLTPADVVLL